MSQELSVSDWIASLKRGNSLAAFHLFHRYFSRLKRFAKRRFVNRNRPATEEEDVAQSVFLRFCNGVQRGKFEYVHNRNELWAVLVRITTNKLIDYHRRSSRRNQRHAILLESELQKSIANRSNGSLIQLIAHDLQEPAFNAALNDDLRQLLDLLPGDEVRNVAVLRLMGNTISEIAEEIVKSERSVERKLRMIRKRWESRLNESTAPPSLDDASNQERTHRRCDDSDFDQHDVETR